MIPVSAPTEGGTDLQPSSDLSEERIVLRGGRPARIFELGRGHRGHLARGFQQLSPHSRYMRFMSLREKLSDRQLSYLSATDGRRHVALGVCVRELAGYREAGVARFVQIPGSDDTAEVAVTVVDAYQGQGLGSALVPRLISLAAERGYRRLQAEMLSENRAALALLQRLGIAYSLRRYGATVVATLELAGPVPSVA